MLCKHSWAIFHLNAMQTFRAVPIASKICLPFKKTHLLPKSIFSLKNSIASKICLPFKKTQLLTKSIFTLKTQLLPKSVFPLKKTQLLTKQNLRENRFNPIHNNFCYKFITHIPQSYRSKVSKRGFVDFENETKKSQIYSSYHFTFVLGILKHLPSPIKSKK
jgi:hypothetical protein